MANLFSHPAFYASGNYTVAGYNMIVSRAVDGAPQYCGTYTSLFSNYTQTTDIVDPSGGDFDLYRVQPILNVTLMNGSSSQITLDFSRPFRASDPLYDMQVSSLIDNYRRNYSDDTGIPYADSTNPAESNGGAVQPFVTDSVTTRMYLSFLPNDDPIKIKATDALVWLGTSKSSATPLVQYQDFYASDTGGYIDFAVAPPTSDYLRVEYQKVKQTDDEIRSGILNAFSSLSNYGINGYQVNQSNNLYYLATPFPNRDLAEITCLIAYRNYLNAIMNTSLKTAEAWKDGQVEYTSDPSRSLQAAAAYLPDVDNQIRLRSNNFIINNRQVIVRGEFESFFDTSGVLPIYSLIVAGANYSQLSWWC